MKSKKWVLGSISSIILIVLIITVAWNLVDRNETATVTSKTDKVATLGDKAKANIGEDKNSETTTEKSEE